MHKKGTQESSGTAEGDHIDFKRLKPEILQGLRKEGK